MREVLLSLQLQPRKPDPEGEGLVQDHPAGLMCDLSLQSLEETEVVYFFRECEPVLLFQILFTNNCRIQQRMFSKESLSTCWKNVGSGGASMGSEEAREQISHLLCFLCDIEKGMKRPLIE